MSCYLRHMGSVFDVLGLENDKVNRKRIDKVIRKTLNLESLSCSEVWKAIRALGEKERENLPKRVAEVILTQ